MAWLAAALLLLGAGAQDRQESGLLGIRMLDRRVATIGHRLAVARPDLCAERQWRPGFALHDLSQYAGDYREAARRAFGLGEGVSVLAVAEGGPADRAGLRADDRLLRMDGQALPASPDSGSAEVLEAALDLVDSAFADGKAVLEVERGGVRRTIAIQAEQGCASRFQLRPSARMNAQADGRHVEVSSAIALYARDDAELAAVLAHEFAHNALKHRSAIEGSGKAGGIFAALSGRSRLMRCTESEADRLSLYLLDAAGYPPEAAISFWTRFGPDRQSPLSSSSHPGWRRRIATLQEELLALGEQKKAGVRAPVPSARERCDSRQPQP